MSVKTQHHPTDLEFLVPEEITILNILADKLRKLDIDKYLFKGGYAYIGEDGDLFLQIWRKRTRGQSISIKVKRGRPRKKKA